MFFLCPGNSFHEAEVETVPKLLSFLHFWVQGRGHTQNKSSKILPFPEMVSKKLQGWGGPIRGHAWGTSKATTYKNSEALRCWHHLFNHIELDYEWSQFNRKKNWKMGNEKSNHIPWGSTATCAWISHFQLHGSINISFFI